MLKRRSFIKQTGLSAAGVITAPGIALAMGGHGAGKYQTVLFQGDSITDGGRSFDRDWNHIMGQSYPYLIASKYWYDHPASPVMFYNRGISGNTVTDLLARWQKDTLNLKPDLISILVGVNDSLFAINKSRPQTALQFREGYEKLISLTQQQLPSARIVICEPFILPVGQVNNNPDAWKNEVGARGTVARDIAQKFNLSFVPLQVAFDRALSKAPANYWIWDGVHPMPAGHQLIAHTWTDVVKL